MSSGRFAFRGYAQQGRRAAGRALADSGVAPTVTPARDGVAVEFRSRTLVIGCRGRTVILDYRSRMTDGGHWR